MSDFDPTPPESSQQDIPETASEDRFSKHFKTNSEGLPPGTGRLNPALLATHRRISQQDRQRVLRDLSGTGSLSRDIKLDAAPLAIKQFLRGEIDLNDELSRRFANAPLMTSVAAAPRDNRPAGRATAMLTSQDAGAILSIDVYSDTNIFEATFTLNHMIALRFHMPELSAYDKSRWVDLMKRDAGTAFLWTSKRWEDDYLIFALRPHYVRLYAFSPRSYEASVRITHPIARKLVYWLGMRWFPSESE